MCVCVCVYVCVCACVFLCVCVRTAMNYQNKEDTSSNNLKVFNITNIYTILFSHHIFPSHPHTHSHYHPSPSPATFLKCCSTSVTLGSTHANTTDEKEPTPLKGTVKGAL